MSKYIEMKKEVQRIAVKSYNEGLVAGTSGNVSLYNSEEQVMAITATNLDYGVMTPEDVVIMSLDGNQFEGELKPSSEWLMHAEVYKQKPEVKAVIHTHSPRATSFAVVHERIPLVLVEMLPFIGGDIPLAKFALPATVELGLSAVEALKERNACLLENHGVLAVGTTLEQAYLRAVYVEDAATIYHFARQVGHPKLVPHEAEETLKVRYNLK